MSLRNTRKSIYEATLDGLIDREPNVATKMISLAY